MSTVSGTRSVLPWTISAAFNLVLGYFAALSGAIVLFGVATPAGDPDRTGAIVLGVAGTVVVLAVFGVLNWFTASWADAFRTRYWLVSVAMLVLPAVVFTLSPQVWLFLRWG